jgi:hypothetical protein
VRYIEAHRGEAFQRLESWLALGESMR